MRTHGTLLFWWLHPASREGGPLSRASYADECWVHTPRLPGVSKGGPPAWGSHFGVLGGEVCGKTGFLCAFYAVWWLAGSL